MQMCLLCPEVALDGFRHEQLEETAKIKRLQRVAISHAYSQALKTLQVLSPPSMRLLYTVDYLYYSNQYLRVASQKWSTHSDVFYMSCVCPG